MTADAAAAPTEPVFEIVEPLGGGPGRLVRHDGQDAFDGLAGLGPGAD